MTGEAINANNGTPYTVYDVATGEIVKGGSTGGDPLLKAGPGQAVHVGEWLESSEWRFPGGVKTAIDQTPTLEDAQTEARHEIDRLHSATLRAATGNATPEEIATWPGKQAAVSAWRAGALAAPAPGSIEEGQLALLTAEAAGDVQSITALVDEIEAKASAYNALAGAATGKRTIARNAVLAAPDESGVEAALDTARAEFAALTA